MTLADAIFPYEECAVRNSTKCEGTHPPGIAAPITVPAAIRGFAAGSVIHQRQQPLSTCHTCAHFSSD